MKTLNMEVCEKNNGQSWHEELSLHVPCMVNSARQVQHNTFEDPVAAAMATMDYFNQTLRPGERPRQVVRVFYGNGDRTVRELWAGCYPK